jgi:hypothetical protein
MVGMLKYDQVIIRNALLSLAVAQSGWLCVSFER